MATWLCCGVAEHLDHASWQHRRHASWLVYFSKHLAAPSNQQPAGRQLWAIMEFVAGHACSRQEGAGQAACSIQLQQQPAGLSVCSSGKRATVLELSLCMVDVAQLVTNWYTCSSECIHEGAAAQPAKQHTLCAMTRTRPCAMATFCWHPPPPLAAVGCTASPSLSRLPTPCLTTTLTCLGLLPHQDSKL